MQISKVARGRERYSKWVTNAGLVLNMRLSKSDYATERFVPVKPQYWKAEGKPQVLL